MIGNEKGGNNCNWICRKGIGNWNLQNSLIKGSGKGGNNWNILFFCQAWHRGGSTRSKGQLIVITCAIINLQQLFSPLYPEAFCNLYPYCTGLGKEEPLNHAQ